MECVGGGQHAYCPHSPGKVPLNPSRQDLTKKTCDTPWRYKRNLVIMAALLLVNSLMWKFDRIVSKNFYSVRHYQCYNLIWLEQFKIGCILAWTWVLKLCKKNWNGRMEIGYTLQVSECKPLIFQANRNSLLGVTSISLILYLCSVNIGVSITDPASFIPMFCLPKVSDTRRHIR